MRNAQVYSEVVMRFESAIARTLQVILLVFFVILWASAANACSIMTTITPLNATADHNAQPPGNQVRFVLASSVKGECPMIPDTRGTWTTSDSDNTAIRNDPNHSGLAVCLYETQQPVTIRYSGRIRGREFPPATLVCK